MLYIGVVGMRVNKNCMMITPALVNFSPWLRICSWLQTDGKLCSSGEGGTDSKDLPVCICMCGSAHDCGCAVDGSNAKTAS